MATTLDMSLDDMIKRTRGGRGGGGGRGRSVRGGGGRGGSFGGGRMTGIVRRGQLPATIGARPSARTIAKSFRRTKRFPWQPDLFEESLRAAGISGVEVGTKLFVSNLHYGVTNEDIRELFSEIGGLKRYAVHFDKNGRPSGTAEVVYARRSDAFAAFKRYNNVLLDGKPMKLEIVGANEGNQGIPVYARVNVTGVQGRKKRTVVMTPRSNHAGGYALPAVNHGSGPSRSTRGGIRNGRGISRGRGRGHGRGHGHGHGRGRGQGSERKKKPVDKSVDELDKELDSYHAEAMQT